MEKLIQVDINDIFKTNIDARKWLINNPKQLEDALNIDLVNYGYYADILKEVRPDIYAEEAMTSNKVIAVIDFDEANNERFTSFIFIVAANNANKAVWIVKNLDDKTRYVLNWLNEKSSFRNQFIVLKLEAYKIGDSKSVAILNRI